MWNSFPPIPIVRPTRRRVFLSYYHQDEFYKNRFETLFGHLFIHESVKFGGIDSDLSTRYIKRLIQEDHVSHASVCVVLVGPRTYCRKHVDWEISAALSKKVGGYSGLLGLCLPNHPNYGSQVFDPDLVPLRLVDNLRSQYARFYDWTEGPRFVKQWVEDAFEARITRSDKIDNNSAQFQHNRC